LWRASTPDNENVMGWETSLSGAVTISPAAFERAMSIRGLDWAWNDDTLADYLRNGFTYDSSIETLRFSSAHKMHHHRAFFDILAALKDRDAVDEVVQRGPTYDAWFESGRFFLRRGTWAYVGEGPMVIVGEETPGEPRVIGPPLATLAHVGESAWNLAPPLIHTLTIDDPWLNIEWLNSKTTRCGVWCSDALLKRMDTPASERFRVCDGGAWVEWHDENGDVAFRVAARDLFSWCEP
jgi:hypothetical protein